MKDDNSGLAIGAALAVLALIVVGAPMLVELFPAKKTPPVQIEKGGMVPPVAAPKHDTSVGGKTTAAMIATNNECVALLNQGKIEQAVDKLEPMLKDNPDYELARDNLAVAYNNLALRQKANPVIALDSLYRSYCLNKIEKATTTNIDGMLTLLKKNPKDFDQREEMGDAQLKVGCLYGAYCEYKAALAIHADTVVESKLVALEKQAESSSNDDLNGAYYVKTALGNFSGPASIASDDVDFGPYMAKLQKTIKKHWQPKKSKSSTRLQVMFTVARDGSVSKLKVFKSSGNKEEDQSGLDAVNSIGKFEPLPTGAPPTVDVQFTFDYNVLPDE